MERARPVLYMSSMSRQTYGANVSVHECRQRVAPILTMRAAGKQAQTHAHTDTHTHTHRHAHRETGTHTHTIAVACVEARTGSGKGRNGAYFEATRTAFLVAGPVQQTAIDVLGAKPSAGFFHTLPR